MDGDGMNGWMGGDGVTVPFWAVLWSSLAPVVWGWAQAVLCDVGLAPAVFGIRTWGSHVMESRWEPGLGYV